MSDSTDIVSEPTATYGKLYTYADYLKWDIEERIEILKGKIFKMSPAPTKFHQDVSREICGIFYNYLKGKPCKMYDAPFDVRLVDKEKSARDEDITTVFQPDICIICDESKLDRRGCLGAPDLVVEILSPSNNKKEMDIKYRIYEENGIREYWMVDPTQKVIFPYILEDGQYRGLKPITEDEEMTSYIFPDLSFYAGELYQF